MAVIDVTLQTLEFNRARTLATLDTLEKLGGETVLGWRPGPGRAHCAWQLMHIAVTEELFATERLFGSIPCCAELVPRFKGGSTPDDMIPSVSEIRGLLEESRAHLKSALGSFSESDLEVIPEAFRERGWTLGTILKVLCWHEPHHQGQAHLALNQWKAAHAEG